MSVSSKYFVLSGRGIFDGRIPSVCVCVCVCVFVSLSVIRCDNNPLHLQEIARTDQTKKGRKNERKKERKKERRVKITRFLIIHSSSLLFCPLSPKCHP